MCLPLTKGATELFPLQRSELPNLIHPRDCQYDNSSLVLTYTNPFWVKQGVLGLPLFVAVSRQREEELER